MRVIGLMSGTSMDGVDAALIEINGDVGDVQWALLRFRTEAFGAEERARIHEAITAGSAPALCRLHADLGEWFARAALAVCADAGLEPRDVDLIGSHGQTVWHDPPGAERGATLQLGDPATIAERTGIPVVSDFRTRDIAAGGQGAPLVPWADLHLYAADRQRALLNIGGMANVTRVPAKGMDEPLLAFDTGPGNALIDGAVELATAGDQRYDQDARMAREGVVDEALLAELLAHPFFSRQPPKSTGREVFGRPYVEAIVARRPPRSHADWCSLVATLTAFTATTIADALDRWVLPHGVAELVVTGGGARNPQVIELLRARLPVPVHTGEDVGIDSDAKEAIAFAALAWAHARGLPGNVPAATGAAGPRILGSYTPSPRT